MICVGLQYRSYFEVTVTHFKDLSVCYDCPSNDDASLTVDVSCSPVHRQYTRPKNRAVPCLDCPVWLSEELIERVLGALSCGDH